MKTFNLLYTIIILSALTACSGNNNDRGALDVPGSDLPPLSDSQSASATKVSKEYNAINNSTRGRGEDRAQQGLNRIFFKNQLQKLTNSVFANSENTSNVLQSSVPPEDNVGASTGDLYLQAFDEDIERAIARGMCDLNISQVRPQDNSSQDSGSIKFSLDMKYLDGNSEICPINMTFNMDVDMNVSSTQSQTASLNLNADFNTRFNIKDEVLKRQFEVHSLDMSMSIDMNGQINQSRGQIGLKMKGNGLIQTKSEGNVENIVTGSATIGMNGLDTQSPTVSLRMTASSELKFEDFQLIGTIVLDGQAVQNSDPQIFIKYFINGDEVSVEEFQDLIPMDGLTDGMGQLENIEVN